MFALGDRVYVLFYDDIARTCVRRDLPADGDDDDYESCAGTIVCAHPLPTYGTMRKDENDQIHGLPQNHPDFRAIVSAQIARRMTTWRQRVATSKALYCVHLDEWYESHHEDAIGFTNVAYCPTHKTACPLCPAHGSPQHAWLMLCLFTIPA